MPKKIATANDRSTREDRVDDSSAARDVSGNGHAPHLVLPDKRSQHGCQLKRVSGPPPPRFYRSRRRKSVDVADTSEE